MIAGSIGHNNIYLLMKASEASKEFEPAPSSPLKSRLSHARRNSVHSITRLVRRATFSTKEKMELEEARAVSGVETVLSEANVRAQAKSFICSWMKTVKEFGEGGKDEKDAWSAPNIEFWSGEAFTRARDAARAAG